MIASIWGENMLGYLSLDIICSSKHTVFLQLRYFSFLRRHMETKKLDLTSSFKSWVPVSKPKLDATR